MGDSEISLDALIAAQDGFFRRYEELLAKGQVTGEESDHLLGQALAAACAEAGLSLEDYVTALERDPLLVNRQKEGLLERVLSRGDGPQAELMRRELARGLQMMRFELTGEEPPDAFWEGMSPLERSRVITAAQANARNDPELLTQVDEALARLRDDPKALGRCAECGDRIPMQRLLAVAYAIRCVGCQIAREQPPTPGAAGTEGRIAIHRW
jgi:RNA polymerase-binding transcription factor DksA